MARRAFYSFHYALDNWRASQIRNMGVVEGNRPCTDNDWETITKGGDEKIKKWVAAQMDGKSCVIVLIGAETAGRKWIDHEIVEGWNNGRGVVGIRVHNLKDQGGNQTSKGANPFAHIRFGDTGRMLSSVVKTYDPPFANSTHVYNHIKNHLADWVDEAVEIRHNA